MEEEKRHTMFASFRARRSPKEVIDFFNYPKSTVYDQWKAWNSFKKNDAHRKKRSRSLGATRTDEFVAEVKRKVNEDGNKSYAKLAAEMGYSKQNIANTINKDLGNRTRLQPTKPPYHWSPDLWPPSSPDCNPLDYFFWAWAAIVVEFANIKNDVVAKACSHFRHRLGMVVAVDGGILKNKYQLDLPPFPLYSVPFI
ncbi:Uncharacterized protein FKW44_005576 [Caligus rogercresseyi]|uniref:Uncharacterized protein n=1 Tax=Caligus rogercresseyi TaxID=217165 RepID=A0A7T8QS61_CALRO|nr:Uncharacterized protein FKW44_005576 [Caligus rogercresseyi]